MDEELAVFILFTLAASLAFFLLLTRMILNFFRERGAARHGAFSQSEFESLLRHVVEEEMRPLHQRMKNVEVKLDRLSDAVPPALPPAEDDLLTPLRTDTREPIRARLQ